jgi:type IV pilus assembly protein PilV
MNLHSNKRQTGYTMVEVLIAVLILAIGLLGVAGVQMRSLQQTSNANLRSQATMVAQEVTEKLRVAGAPMTSAQEDVTIRSMQGTLGGGADLTISYDGPIATIQVDWSEREQDLAQDEGVSAEQLIISVQYL